MPKLSLDQFAKIVDRLALAFPGALPAGKDSLPTIKTWFDAVKSLEEANVQRAVSAIVGEIESLPRGCNVGAFIANRSRHVLTIASVTAMLQRAVELARSPSGDPYAFLAGVDKRLVEAAERVDLFSRDLTTENLGYRTHQAAQQFLEERENTKRGYLPPESVTGKNLLPAPGETTITEEQRQKNLERIRALKSRLAA